MRDQADRLLRAGELKAAAELYARLAKQNPRDAGTIGQLGSLQVQIGQIEPGRKNLIKAVKLDPRSPEIRHELAVAYRAAGRLSEALDTIDKALRIDPEHADLIATRVDFLRTMARDDEAWEMVSPAIEQGRTEPALALAFARLCAKRGQAERGVGLLEACLSDQSLPYGFQMDARFRLGELLEKLGRFDEAFAAYSAGNAMITTHHDPDAFSGAITGVIEAWSAQELMNAADTSVRSDLPLLILGMPRSGTTLVEQILASHSKVAAGGELKHIMSRSGELSGTLGGMPACPTPAQCSRQSLDRAARQYIRELTKIGPSAARVTDKLPMNYLYLGLIDRMLPGARVIHCVRDPMDVCLSCFFTDFAGQIAVAADLSHIGRFYLDYKRLMSHWLDVVRLPVLEVRYEDLVSDLETHARRIIDHAGLEWEDDCLRFHETKRIALTASVEQVRRPLYASSVGRHTRFESHLGSLRSALGAESR